MINKPNDDINKLNDKYFAESQQYWHCHNLKSFTFVIFYVV